MSASTLTSRTAEAPDASSAGASVTTAAASMMPVPPLTADATAYCSAVSASDGRPTVAPAYVRPSPSRTAAPSSAPVRARAARASVTNFASSADSSAGAAGRSALASGIGRLPLLLRHRLGVGGLNRSHEDRVDAVATAGRTLRGQQQTIDGGVRARDRYAAE